MTRRDHLIFVGVALLIAGYMVYGVYNRPTYTDAYYYINAANRLSRGDGLTDEYLWTYIGAPDELPAPSHLYWMPMPSLTAAFGMWLFNAPEDYRAAQFPYWLMLALLGYTGFWLGARLGGTRRHAWAAGLIVLFGGFFARYWGVIESFTPFGVFGAGCLVALGRGMVTRQRWWFVLAGALAAGAHLSRADGLLFVIAGIAALLWVFLFDRDEKKALSLLLSFWKERREIIRISGFTVSIIFAYVVVMSPWAVRNLQLIGSPLPVGGAQGIWYTEYNDIFAYPPDATPQTFWQSGGWSLLLESRWQGLSTGIGTFIAIEGVIVLAPLMLIGLWNRRRDPFLTPFWIYVVGLHLAMTLVFPFPGSRGGLFHSATALFPFWAALGIVGLDDLVDWVVKRRRRWNPIQAKRVFTGAVLVIVLALTILSLPAPTPFVPPIPDASLDDLPADARVMINDPAQLYYWTGRGGVVLPDNAAPDVIPEIAAQYDIDYLFLEFVTEDGIALAAPEGIADIPANTPAFLTEIPLDDDR
ncbi:MAG: hypothetical protein AAFR22_14115, partial [Chloroflexota bacterium]